MAIIPATYKAYIYEEYGKAAGVLKIAQVPVLPLAKGHVRIKVHSASINPIDYLILEVNGVGITGGSPSKNKPYRIGYDASGVIAEVGDGVTEFKVGDVVFARAETPNAATIAEFAELESDFVAPMPKNLSFDEAASVPLVAITSYQALFTHANVAAGQRVLILGGSSSCGIFAIQFAKHAGAFVATTSSAKNTAFVKSLGADVAIDYQTQKWVDVLDAHSIDVILDCGMEMHSWNKDAQNVLKKQTGRYVSLLPIPDPIVSPIGATQTYMVCASNGQDLAKIGKLIEEGHVETVVDSIVPFEELVKGIERVQTRRAVGKVVVKVL